MNGILIDDQRVLVTDAEAAKPVHDVPASDAPEGYAAKGEWVDAGTEIVRSWRLVPEGGHSVDLYRSFAGARGTYVQLEGRGWYARILLGKINRYNYNLQWFVRMIKTNRYL